MCGVAGLFAYHPTAAAIDRRALARASEQMAARGPDGSGEWHDAEGRVGLAHRRLAIIDLSEGGAQPMASADGRLVVTFNGEIYNYRALRTELEAAGCMFRTQSDTEVLLHLYAEKGEAMVRDLRGMFAFAIWDAAQRSLLLARDPFGIKPLYYSDDGGTLFFASQVKALLAGGVPSAPDPAGWVGFHLLGSVPEPFTAHAAIRAVPAGATIRVDATGVHPPVAAYSLAAAYRRAEAEPSPLRGDDALPAARDALLDSVRHHLVADVPVGAFLSAGIDSGALVGLMRDAGHADIQTVTVAFEEFRGQSLDEAPLAETVARRYGTRHTTWVVTERDFREWLPRILDAMDQPSIDGINTWLVSKAAHELGLKVAVSGLGGDELFGGYSTFREVPGWVRRLRLAARMPGAGRAFRSAAGALTKLFPTLSPKLPGLVEYGGAYPGAYLLRRGLFMPFELPRLLGDPAFVREGLERLDPLGMIAAALTPEPATAFGKIATLESSLYMRNQLLRDTDWASMAHSLEVRVPLVDPVLTARIAPLMVADPSASAKRLLAAAPGEALPDAVVSRPKTGFATPLGQWLERRSPRAQGGGRARAREPWARSWSRSIARAAGGAAPLAVEAER